MWVYRAEGAILHACAVGDGKVVFGDSSGKICAVNVGDGKLAWSVQTGAGRLECAADPSGHGLGRQPGWEPLCHRLGSRGPSSGRAATGGPLLSSPALDAAKGRVYVASEDMHVYAFDLG